MPHPNAATIQKRALVLSGGSLKGAAFIGVLKALQEAGASFDIFGGSSAGSVVAVLAGAGLSIQEMEKLMHEISQMPPRRLRDLNLKGIFSLINSAKNYHGLIKGDKLENYFQKKLNSFGITTFQSFKAPTFVVAVNLLSGKEQIFTNLPRGDIRQACHTTKVSVAGALRASISIPGIFIPKALKNGIYIDGGIRSYLPILTAERLGADAILGITFSHSQHSRAQLYSHGMVSILSRSVDLSIEDQLESDVALLQENGSSPTLISLEMTNPHLFDLKEIPQLIKAGYDSMQKLIRQEPEIIKNFLG